MARTSIDHFFEKLDCEAREGSGQESVKLESLKERWSVLSLMGRKHL